jgi:hypothetical protein
MKVLGKWVKGVLEKLGDLAILLRDEKNAVAGIWHRLDGAIKGNSFDHLILNAREVMNCVRDLVCGVLLLADAAGDVKRMRSSAEIN